jgi:hypothetical protein
MYLNSTPARGEVPGGREIFLVVDYGCVECAHCQRNFRRAKSRARSAYQRTFQGEHAMVERRKQTGERHGVEGRVIPFRHANGSVRPIEVLAEVTPRRARTRTLRPVDIVFLLPIIAPVAAAILLGLLGWFVAWLAVVGMLVTAIVFTDLARAVQWRLHGAAIRPFDPHAIGGR